MAHKNYTKFSERFKKSEGEEVINEINEKIENEIKEEVMGAPVDAVVEPTAEATDRIFNPNPVTVEEPAVENYIKEGTVVECEKLNVRKNPSPNAEVLCILNKGDKVQVDLKIEGEPAPADVSFYQVIIAAGVKGYCVTKFISIE